MLANAEWHQPADAVQQVSLPPALDTFASALFTLSRLPAGLWTILTLSEIDRLNRKSLQATLDALVRAMGGPKTEIWRCVVEAEQGRLVRARLVRSHYLAYTLTAAGRETLREARETLESVMGKGGLTHSGAGVPTGQGERLVPAGQNTTPIPISAGTSPNPADTLERPARSRVRQPAATH